MRWSVHTVLLFASALSMLFGAVGYALVIMPGLHGDLVEIGVRPTVLGGTVLHLYFAGIAAALVVIAGGLRTSRALPRTRLDRAVAD